jgi:SAM-dependent methyltransferase
VAANGVGRNPAARIGATFENVDSARDRGRFGEYLREFSALTEVKRYKQEAFSLCELQPGQHVLDVGCGVGDDVRALAARVQPGGSATGLDRSESMIEACSRHRPVDGATRFVLGDGDSMPFEDDRFDVVRADRVLVHVADPVAVVQEMVRVANADARIVLTEGDFDTFVIDADDLEFSRRVAQLRCERFRSGRIGRRLTGLLAQAGIPRVTASASSIILRSLEAANRFWGVEELVAEAVVRGEVSPDLGRRWLDDQRRRDGDGRFFCSLTGFAAAGRKPQ